jgi:hypothetical protein
MCHPGLPLFPQHKDASLTIFEATVHLARNKCAFVDQLHQPIEEYTSRVTRQDTMPGTVVSSSVDVPHGIIVPLAMVMLIFCITPALLPSGGQV